MTTCLAGRSQELGGYAILLHPQERPISRLNLSVIFQKTFERQLYEDVS